MKKLNIENFLNEMSYDLRMEELERAVIKYQDVLVEYFISSQYTYKEKKRFHNVCSIVRSEKFLVTMDKLIHEVEMVPDMAYVVATAISFPYVDKEVKFRGLEIAYKLRSAELEETQFSDNIKMLLASLTTWTITGYTTPSYFRVKTAEHIISKLPKALANTYRGVDPSAFSSKNIWFIICTAVKDLTKEEMLTAFLKSEFKYENGNPYQSHAIVIRKFVYELCTLIGPDTMNKCLTNACESMLRFNKRHNTNESFKTKYLDLNIIEKVATDKSFMDKRTKSLENIRTIYEILKRFKINNNMYSSLF